MSKPKTYVAIVLDKSGSMARTKDKTISGYNEQIQQLKENAKEQDIKVSLVTFNGDVYEHVWNESVDSLSEAKAEDYVPLGGTAMRDAVGFTIKRLVETTDSTDPDAAYLVIVISDGETNSDKIYRDRAGISALKELIEGCQATGKWTFTYMGCSTAYLEQLSRETGISASNMAAWDNSSDRTTTMGFAASATRSCNYFDSRAKGITAVSTYMNDEEGKVADFSQVETTNTGSTVNDTVIPTWNAQVTTGYNTGITGGLNLKNNHVSPPSWQIPTPIAVDEEELRNTIVNSSYEVHSKPNTEKSVFANSGKVVWKK